MIKIIATIDENVHLQAFSDGHALKNMLAYGFKKRILRRELNVERLSGCGFQFISLLEDSSGFNCRSARRECDLSFVG